MIPKITVARLRRPALLTSAGFVVSLLAAPWSAAPAPGGIRPSRIASTAQVPSPTISSGAGGGVAPALIASTAIVGAPALAVAAIPTISPATIAAGAAVGVPVLSNGSGQPIAPPALGPSSAVQSPSIASSAPGSIAPTTIASVASVGTPTIATAPGEDTGGVSVARNVRSVSGSLDEQFTIFRTGDTSGPKTATWQAIVSTLPGRVPTRAADFGGVYPTGTVTWAAGATDVKTVTITPSNSNVLPE